MLCVAGLHRALGVSPLPFCSRVLASAGASSFFRGFRSGAALLSRRPPLWMTDLRTPGSPGVLLLRRVYTCLANGFAAPEFLLKGLVLPQKGRGPHPGVVGPLGGYTALCTVFLGTVRDPHAQCPTCSKRFHGFFPFLPPVRRRKFLNLPSWPSCPTQILLGPKTSFPQFFRVRPIQAKGRYLPTRNFR